MTFFYSTFPTPLGDFSIAVNAAGEVAASAFGTVEVLCKRLHLRALVSDSGRTATAQKQVEDYFAGRRREFSLPLAAPGTEFQTRTWAALRSIPFGETRTYGQLARSIGRPTASRAVGRANATNPICLVVPCHRVIGSDGSMTGFAFGEDLKRRLLDHERTLRAARAA